MIYLDNCATTRVDDDVLALFQKYSTELYYNPSALYREANGVAKAIEQARSQIANVLHCSGKEVFFTSGGTEGDNIVLSGSLRPGDRLLTTAGEHSAVYQVAQEWKSRGISVEYLKLNADGSVREEDLLEKLQTPAQMVSIMHVNNETGVVNDIQRLCALTKSRQPKCLFMTDGVQSFCKIPTDIKNLGVDFFTCSSHKIHGPKGVGAVYHAKALRPILYGGGQEGGLRSGTENVAGIVAFGLAAEKENALQRELSERFLAYTEEILSALQNAGLSYLVLSEHRAPNIFSFALKDVNSEVLMRMLDDKGIIVGIGSACNSRHGRDRVVKAIGLPGAYVNGVVRIGYSKYNTPEEIKTFCTVLTESAKIVSALIGGKK
mgnify:CR=1 FL=1